MFNIGFIGKAGAGKSYLCRYLTEKHGYIQAKMATGVYAIAKQYFNMEEKNKDRRLLQYLGTDIGRKEIDNQLWVNRFLDDTYIAQRTYQDLYNKEVYFCSDDVRFENEKNALAEEGWVLIYLDVPDSIRLRRLESRDGTAQLETLNHISETEIDTFKDELLHLDVSGTLEKSYQNLEELLEYIKKENLYGNQTRNN